MSRIRTIQPDAPFSESLSRISLEASMFWYSFLLCFDDGGRARADVTLVAARVFPRRRGLEGPVRDWMDEFEREGMIERYRVDDVEYMRAVNWHRHQRVDRPTASRLPPSPTELAKAREASRGCDRTADKMLEENDNPASAEVAREIEKLPRKEDGSLDIGRAWLIERMVEQYFEAKVTRKPDHMLRSGMMLGRLIGWAGDERRNGPRAGANPAVPSAGPSLDSLFSEEMKTGVPKGYQHASQDFQGTVLDGHDAPRQGAPSDAAT